MITQRLLSDVFLATERCCGRYSTTCRRADKFKSVLELGCGTGNLSVLLHTAFPDAGLRLVDISGESLEVCRSRLETCRGLVCEQNDFGKLAYNNESFDLVVSSIAIHHFDSIGKQLLFRQVKDWLSADGVFCFADQCAGATDDLYARHIHHWKDLSFKAGSSDSEWEMWMQHQADHDHHDTLAEQLDWLREAGFPVVDCTWRYLLWSVIQARK